MLVTAPDQLESGSLLVDVVSVWFLESTCPPCQHTYTENVLQYSQRGANRAFQEFMNVS